MNHTVKYLALFSLAFSLAACDDDGLDVRDVEIPQGYALSAGISSIFRPGSPLAVYRYIPGTKSSKRYANAAKIQ